MQKFLAILLLLALGACTSEASRVSGDAQIASEWERLPDSPLSPREFPVVVAAGDKVLVVGGSDGQPCPPNAGCLAPLRPPLRDGASFDVRTRAWERLPDAPTGVTGAQTARLNGSTFFLLGTSSFPGTKRALLEFANGVWKEHQIPDGDMSMSATQQELILYPRTHENGYQHDVALDPKTDQVRELPRDPLAPSFDRYMTWTGKQLVLTAKDDVEQPGSEKPALIRAAALDGTRWRSYRDSESIGSDPWFFVAGRLVLPVLGRADGGEVNGWGRSYDNGAILDPETGAWSSLPNAPEPAGAGTLTECAATDDRTFCHGYAFHVASGSWTALPVIEGGRPWHAGAAIARNELIVWGGALFGDRNTLSNTGWSLKLG